MTPEEAKKSLVEQGFELEDPDVHMWTSIFLADERVGTMYDDEVYLAQHMPSLFEGNYQSTSKSCIKYSESQAEEKLQSAIDRLKYSLREYEKEKRKQRVKRVKEYFQQRNEAYKLIAKMDGIQARIDTLLEKLT
jgi:6-phosphogluconolactonase/glucosamine-6-phosphate isomerase/deaminase